MEALNKDEQKAIKPHTDKIGGRLVLANSILGPLTQASPAAATLVQQGAIRSG